MHYLIKIIKNRNFLLVLAFIFGLSFNHAAVYIKDYLMYILAFMLSISLSAFNFKAFLPLRNTIRPILITLLMNYLIFGGLIMGLAYLLLDDPNLINGFWFITLAPPGVVIIPFILNAGGSIEKPVIGIAGAYLLLFLIFPAGMLLSGMEKAVPLSSLISSLVILIALPLGLSRLMRGKKAQEHLKTYRGRYVDVSFFFIVYTIIGLNRDVFVHQPEELLLPLLILALVVFGGSSLLWPILKTTKIPPEKYYSYQLVYSIKNNGFAAVTALSTGIADTALPAAAMSVVLLIYLILFGMRKSIKEMSAEIRQEKRQNLKEAQA